MPVLWISISLGVLIVLLAVGVPYWLTHRRMRPHYDLTESYEYLDAAGKTPEDAAAGRPGHPRDDADFPTPPGSGRGPVG